jgi:hypothetical protein
MIYRVVPLLFVGLVAACAGSEAGDQEMRTHQLSCIKSGHAVDTPEYTDCVINRHQKTRAERDRMRENIR